MSRFYPLIGAAHLWIVFGAHVAAQSTPKPTVLSAEEVTSVRSIVGGGAQWSPDGTSMLIGGALGGSDLWTIPADGGFPRSLNIRMGEVAFQASNAARYAPDGKSISYLANVPGGAAELHLHSLSDGTRRQITRLGARIISYSWSPDGRRIALASDKYGSYDIWVADVASAGVHRLTKDARYEVFPSWTPDGRKVVYVRLDERWLDHDVLEIDASGATTTPRVIVSDTDFFDYGAGSGFGYPLISPDGASLVFRSHRSGWINYWIVPMSGGTPRQLAPEAANQSGARWSPDGKSILYTALWNGTQDLRVISVTGGAPRKLAAPTAMGMVSNAEWSPNGALISYTMETPVDPADLYVIPSSGGTAKRLTISAGPAYITNALIRPKKVAYRTPDGFSINAYLYEPVLKPGEIAPGILYIHGGPTSSFNDNYQAQVQFLAMRGYAVLLPNIRGSSGYGKAFEDANNGCWGRCDLVDVTAGVEYLRTLPYVDDAHMGITGTSYGGCMTLAAAAFAPGVFQAGVAVSGYGDWFHMIQEQELRHLKLVEYEFGTLPKNEAKYRASSPIFSIASIRTPLMLLHGSGAQFPRSDASTIFADRLEMNYKPFVYKTYPNENYYVRRRENFIQMYADIVAYFDQHLKNGTIRAGG
ncbi:MAG: alpha/beta fold hydrolase [Gemmatimonadaceae bacterium]